MRHQIVRDLLTSFDVTKWSVFILGSQSWRYLRLMMYGAKILSILILLAGLATATSALAGQRGYDNWRVAEAQAVPLETVIANVRAQYPGRLLDARTVRRGSSGRLYYQLSWLTSNGRKLNITADASSGAIVGVRGN